MEPRPHERGNVPYLIVEAGEYKLQWSHVLTNVETIRGEMGKAWRGESE